jgi:hypothetical protein
VGATPKTEADGLIDVLYFMKDIAENCAYNNILNANDTFIGLYLSATS